MTRVIEDQECGNCRFGRSVHGYGAGDFCCRRYAPKPRDCDWLETTDTDIGTIWPLVDSLDWCGEWQERPVK